MKRFYDFSFKNTVFKDSKPNSNQWFAGTQSPNLARVNVIFIELFKNKRFYNLKKTPTQ